MSDTLETRVKAIEERNKAFEEQNKVLQKEVQLLKDIEDIKRLQRIYSFYLEHIMWNELADLWAEDGECYWVGSGIFKGRETIRKLWSMLPGAAGNGSPELLHLDARFSPVITVAPDGKTAKGRWYVIGGGILPIGKDKRVSNAGGFSNDENEYIKENGVWKIWSLKHGGILGWKWDLTIPKDRIATPEDFKNDQHGKYYPFTTRFGEDTPVNEYPSGYILPFHFKHPVTGKETSEAAHNAAMPPFKRPNFMI